MRKVKKSTVIPLALLVYVTAMAIYFLPHNTAFSTTEKYFTLSASYIIVFLLWLVMRKKEAMQRKLKERDQQYFDELKTKKE